MNNPVDKVLLDESQRVEEIVKSFPKDRRFALAALQSMQHEFNYVPRYGLEYLSEHLECYESELYAMSSFYKAFSLKPKGKHIIKICDGTACHIRGGTNLVLGLERELGIKPGETTKDGEFSVELVNCVGSCALAPVMVINENYHNRVSMDQIPGILDLYRTGGERDE